MEFTNENSNVSIETNLIRPKPGDIVLVNGPWTKGKTFFYLVDFYDGGNWTSCYRIHGEGYHYMDSNKNKKLHIPAEYLRGRTIALSGGFVNIFTGKTSININNITEIVSTISKNIYMNIIGSVVSLMMGNYFRDENNKFILKDFKMDVRVPIAISDILSSIVGLDSDIGGELIADNVCKNIIEAKMTEEDIKFNSLVNGFKKQFNGKVPVLALAKKMNKEPTKVTKKAIIMSLDEIVATSNTSVSNLMRKNLLSASGVYRNPSYAEARYLHDACISLKKYIK